MEYTITVSIISAIIALVSTIASCFSAWVAKKNLQNSLSPNIIAYLSEYSESNLFYSIVLHNVGNAPAYNVKMSLQNSLVTDEALNEVLKRGIAGSGIDVLPPNSRQEFPIGIVRNINDEQYDTQGIVNIHYSDRTSKREPINIYKTITLSFSSLASNMHVTTSKEQDYNRAIRAIPKIENHLGKICKKLK